MSRIRGICSALGVAAALLLASTAADAGLVGAKVKPIFYADIPSIDADPQPLVPNTSQVDDDTHGTLAIANGTSLIFHDYFYENTPYGFGDFMRVTFTNTQIILTNLIPGIYPEYTAASFDFVSLIGSISNVTLDATSSPLFAMDGLPVITFTGHSILVDLSNTCGGDVPNDCVGTTRGGPGESIVLDIATVPEPATMALLFMGLIPLTLRRRKTAA